MDTPQDEHTFLIRIRLEARETTLGPRFWRGTIEHLRSQTKQAIKNEREITAFIRQFLAPDATEQTPDFWRRWLKRLRWSGSIRRPK